MGPERKGVPSLDKFPIYALSTGAEEYIKNYESSLNDRQRNSKHNRILALLIENNFFYEESDYTEYVPALSSLNKDLEVLHSHDIGVYGIMSRGIVLCRRFRDEGTYSLPNIAPISMLDNTAKKVLSTTVHVGFDKSGKLKVTRTLQPQQELLAASLIMGNGIATYRALLTSFYPNSDENWLEEQINDPRSPGRDVLRTVKGGLVAKAAGLGVRCEITAVDEAYELTDLRMVER